MKNILIILTLMISPVVTAAELCSPIDRMITLGNNAANCGAMLEAGMPESETLATNKYCQSYLKTKDEAVASIILMHKSLLEFCLSNEPSYVAKLKKVNVYVKTLNPYLTKHGY